jgi:opacity protein-like surface antigen
MTKWLLLLLMALVSAPAALAQNSDYTRYEFYGGYAYQRADNNAATIDRNGTATFGGKQVILGSRDQAYNGFSAEFNQNPWRHVGLVTSFTGVYDRTPYVNILNGKSFSAKVQRYDLMFGPRYNFRLGAVNPFVEGLAGFEHMRVSFSDNITNATASDTAFAMQLGGGLDIHAGEHFDIRAIQVDYLPTFFNGTHQNNYRVGAGVKVKFGEVP